MYIKAACRDDFCLENSGILNLSLAVYGLLRRSLSGPSGYAPFHAITAEIGRTRQWHSQVLRWPSSSYHSIGSHRNNLIAVASAVERNALQICHAYPRIFPVKEAHNNDNAHITSSFSRHSRRFDTESSLGSLSEAMKPTNAVKSAKYRILGNPLCQSMTIGRDVTLP